MLSVIIFLIRLCVLIIAIIVAKFFVKWIYKRYHPETYCEAYDYTEDDILTVMPSVFVNRWIFDRKLIITLRYRERVCVCDTKRQCRQEIVRTEYWTDEKTKNIHLDGFKRVRGMHDSMLWLGVRMYMRVDNVRYFAVPDTKTNGKFDYPQDTAETLHDYASSNATQKFIAAMSKTALANMDTHTLIMIIILAVGAIFGMHLFGVF